GNTLLIVDTNYNRALIYTGGSTTPSSVLGQADYVSAGSNRVALTASALNSPSGVAFDSDNNIYIGDYSNQRVLVYPSGSTTPIQVYGTAGSYTSAGTTFGWDSLRSANSIAISSTGVYICDGASNRVLYYTGFTNTTASLVYGQSGSPYTTTANKGGTNANGLN